MGKEDFINGSRLDERPINQVQGSMRRTKNMMYKEGLSSLMNEYGFKNTIETVNGVAATDINGYTIGIIPAATKVVIFSVRAGNISEIGILDGTAYTTIVRSALFNFSTARPIQGTFFYNYKGDLTVTWWDGVEVSSRRPKILNLDELPFQITAGYDFVNPLDYNLSRLFPDFDIPEIDLERVQDGGGILKAGVYYFTISYMINEFDETAYSQLSNPIYIGEYLDKLEFLQGLQNNADSIMGQSISISFTGLDTRFSRFKISLIRKSNQITTAHEVAVLNLPASGNISYTYNGTNRSDIADVAIAIGQRASFTKVKTGDNVRAKLINGNLEQQERINYQCYANAIQANWVTIDRDIEEFADPTIMFDEKGTTPDEIYALYMGFVLPDGTRTEAFHIPGRRAISVNIAETSNGVVFTSCCHDGFVRLIVLNTTPLPEGIEITVSGVVGTYTVTDSNYFTQIDAQAGASVILAEIAMGTFIGTTCFDNIVSQVYITGGSPYMLTTNDSPPPALIPDFTIIAPIAEFIADNISLNVYTYIQTDIPCVGSLAGSTYNTSVTASFMENDLIASNPFTNFEERDLSPHLRHFHIRETSKNGFDMGYWENKDEYYPDTDDFDVCDATGVIDTIRNENVRHHKLPGSERMYGSTEEYATKALGISFSNIYIPPEIESQVKEFYFLYAKRTVKNSTVLGGSLVLPQVSYSGSGINFKAHQGYRVFPFHLMTSTPTIGVSYLKSEFRLLGYATYDTNGIQHTIHTFVGDVLKDDNRIEPIYAYEYVEEDNSAHHLFNNEGREKALFLRSKGRFGTPIHSPFRQGITEIEFQITNHGGDYNNFNTVAFGELHYGLIKSLLLNVYVNFYDQELASTNKFFPVTNGTGNYNANSVFNWDTFNGKRLQYHKRNIVDAALAAGYLTPASPYDTWEWVAEIYHGEYTTDNIYFSILTRGIRSKFRIGQTYDYDKTYSALNDLKVPVAYHPYINYISKLPYRVALSLPQQDEDKAVAWRIFYTTSYYEMPRDKGVIWCIKGTDAQAYIQMKNSLFVTTVKDVIKTDTLVAYLQSSDLFDRPPQEVETSDEGYIGCGDMFSCIVIPQGYAVYDRERQRVFAIKGEKAYILSDAGYKEYFQQNGSFVSAVDNPYGDNGVHMLYDDTFNRLIIVINKQAFEEVSYTLSFDVTKGIWIGEHDYKPNMMFALRNGAYALGNHDEVYKFHDKTKYGIYLDQTVNPCYFEIVFNQFNDVVKHFKYIDWDTELINSGVSLYGKTFTHIMVYDNNKCTGIVNLANGNAWYEEVADPLRGSWNYNKFRDLVDDITQPFMNNDGTVITTNININKPFFEKSKFIGKFIVVRFIYDNVDQNKLHATNVGINYTHYRKGQGQQ